VTLVTGPSHTFCRDFNEVYLPWLNDLPRQRLEAEFTTLHSYLQLLDGGMGSEAVRGLIRAYLRAIIARAKRGDSIKEQP